MPDVTPRRGEKIFAWAQRVAAEIASLRLSGDGRTTQVRRSSAGTVVSALSSSASPAVAPGEESAYSGEFAVSVRLLGSYKSISATVSPGYSDTVGEIAERSVSSISTATWTRAYLIAKPSWYQNAWRLPFSIQLDALPQSDFFAIIAQISPSGAVEQIQRGSLILRPYLMQPEDEE